MLQEKLPKMDDVKIHRMQIKDEGKLLATLDLEYLGFVIRGFRITRTDKLDSDIKNYAWIQPPCVNARNKWIELIRVSDKEAWKLLKIKIFGEYQLANDQYYREKFNTPAPTPAIPINQRSSSEPEVNIDDVTF